MIGGWSWGQGALRVAIALGVPGALLSTGLVGTPPRAWLVFLVVALSLGYARFPESAIGTVAMGIVVVWWGVSLRDGLHPEALIAAAGLLTSHVAGLVAAYGPDELPVDTSTLRLWLLRAGGAFVLAPLLLLVSVLLRDRPEPPGIWVAGLAVALAATLVALWAFTGQEDSG